MTRARDLSNDEANGGGATPPFVAGKNFLIGGGFDHWQRGTTLNAATHSTYTADQWVMVNDSVGTVNITRQNIADQGLGVVYAMRVEKSAGVNNRVVMVAVPEGALNCVGKTVTLSGYLRKGSGLSSNVTIDIGTRVTRYGTQYDGASSVQVSNASLSTTSFTRFSTTFNVTTATSTNNANLFEVEIRFDQAGGSNVFLDFAAMQIEVGPVATPFSRAGGTVVGELALCQRYFQTLPTAILIQGYSSVAAIFWWQPKVDMRAVPTVTLSTTSPYWESVPYTTVGSLTGAALNATKLTASGGTLVIAGTFSPTPVANYPTLLNGSVLTFSAEI
jgi:hypothetical protein